MRKTITITTITTAAAAAEKEWQNDNKNSILSMKNLKRKNTQTHTERDTSDYLDEICVFYFHLFTFVTSDVNKKYTYVRKGTVTDKHRQAQT